MQMMNTAQIDMPEAREAAAPRAGVTVEWIAYLVLAALALVLRLAELDSVPLFDAEARQALAAVNVLKPEAFGDVPSAQSPLLLFLHSVAFSLLGTTEFSTRIFTALAGAGVAFAPLLFRDVLGRSRAFLMSLLLVFSPVLLLASRFDSGFVWTVLLAAFGGAALLRYRRTATPAAGVLAVIFGGAALLLTDPGSLPFALMLALAAWLSLVALRSNDDENEKPKEADTFSWSQFPLLRGVGLAALVVFLVSTLFMLHPAGLSNVGELVAGTMRGFTIPQPGTPLYVLLISVFYETFYWILGLVAIVVAQQRGLSTLDRFFIVWLVLGLIASALFVGGTSAHALWLTIPLVGLVSRLAQDVMREDTRLIWHFPIWARWIVAVAMVALLAIFSVSFQMVARSLMRQSPELGFDLLLQLDRLGAVIVVMSLVFFVVGFFLAASLWDTLTAARGVALGMLVFGAVTSLGSGWRAATASYANPSEPWHFIVSTPDAVLLRETLIEVAKRESRGFPMMTVAAAVPGDGVVAWLLRDFTSVRPISSPAEVEGEEMVVLLPPQGGGEAPDLGGAYVGQDFLVRRIWGLENLPPLGLLSWWLERDQTEEGAPFDTIVLWLRQDAYLGIQPAE